MTVPSSTRTMRQSASVALTLGEACPQEAVIEAWAPWQFGKSWECTVVQSPPHVKSLACEATGIVTAFGPILSVPTSASPILAEVMAASPIFALMMAPFSM